MNRKWRLRQLFRRREADRSMDDELRFHLEMEAEKNIGSGLDPAEARRRAQLAFGSVEVHREALREGRSMGWMERRATDLAHALRTLRRSPAVVGLAIGIIGLGIAAATIVFSAAHGVLLRPLDFPAPERLIQVHETERNAVTAEQEGRGYFAWQNYADVRDQVGAFEAVTAWQFYDRTLTGLSAATRLAGRMVTADFFDVFRVQPILGRPLLPEDAVAGRENVAVLGHATWRGAFGGDSTIVGRTIQLDGIPHTVVGVMPSEFDYPSEAQLWMPLVPYLGEAGEGARRFHRYRVVGRLADGATVDLAQQELTALATRLEQEFPETNTANGLRAEPLHEMIVGSARPGLILLLGAVGVLLLITCVNVSNLLLARAAAREREMGVRKALGASRGRLVGQLLTESTLMAVLGGGLGVVLAIAGLGAFKGLVGDALPRADDVRLDLWAISFAILLSTATGLLVGLAPVLANWRSASRRVVENDRGSSGGRSMARARRLLVTAQLALACVLLISAGLLIRSLHRLQTVETGVRVENLTVVDVSLPPGTLAGPEAINAQWSELLTALRGVPGVVDVAAGMIAPLAGEGWGNQLRIEGRPVPESERSLVAYFVATSGYFRTAGVPLLEGADFTPTPGLERREVIVNRALAAQHWPDQSPIGQRVRFSEAAEWGRVVGVVADVPPRIGEDPRPTAYVSPVVESLPSMSVLLRTDGSGGSVGATVRAIVQSLDPDIAITGIAPLEDLVAESIARPRYMTLIVGLFAGAALLLSALGIYGVLSFLVRRRRRELGVRLALGARSMDILRLVMAEGLAMALVGVGIGMVAALAVTRLLQGLLYEVTVTDPLVFIAGSALLIAVTLLSTYLPARVASRVDPMGAVRGE
ncbi:MAG: ABC transporter permease [Gemmatimonadota bacterium]